MGPEGWLEVILIPTTVEAPGRNWRTLHFSGAQRQDGGQNPGKASGFLPFPFPGLSPFPRAGHGLRSPLHFQLQLSALP